MIKTASLKNSQRLVALGVVLETEFQHVEYLDVHKQTTGQYAVYHRNEPRPSCQVISPAPTADELGEILRRHESRVIMLRVSSEYIEGTESLADCFIKSVIWLLEQGHITKEEVNDHR